MTDFSFRLSYPTLGRENRQVENFLKFYEEVARCYPEEQIVFQTLRGQLRKKFVLRYLQRFRGRLLDVGCNRGYYLAQYRNGSRFGVDIAYPALKEAKSRVPAAHFVQGDAQTLTFIRPNSFDAILCSEVIEHVPSPERIFEGCYRVLKPGGEALITTPNYKKKRPTWIRIGALKSFGIRGVRGEYYYHTAFRPEELRSMAEKVGFHVQEVGTLEKEVKYATRAPVMLYYLVDFFNRLLLNSSRVQRFNEKLLECASLGIYRMVEAVGLNGLLKSLIQEGVRSYIYLKK